MTAQEFAASLEALIGTARDGNMSGEEMIILLREAAATLQGLLDIARRLDPMVLRCKVCSTLRAGSIPWFYAGAMSGRQETVAITRPSTSPPTPCC
jgi:hypothetical protein